MSMTAMRVGAHGAFPAFARISDDSAKYFSILLAVIRMKSALDTECSSPQMSKPQNGTMITKLKKKSNQTTFLYLGFVFGLPGTPSLSFPQTPLGKNCLRARGGSQCVNSRSISHRTRHSIDWYTNFCSENQFFKY
jgi:hypothetical protein